MTEPQPEPWTEERLLSLLRAHHGDSRKWAFLTKVADGTGFGVTGWCDALAMSLWPSKGLNLYGYEVKVSRSDWQREMQRPEKAETFASRCHYFFVAAPKGVVRLEELPALWGLIEPAGSGMRVRRAPTFRQPIELDYEFLAAILRYAVQQSPHEEFLKEERKKAREEGREAERQNQQWQKETVERERDNLKKSIETFQAASGVDIDRYYGEQIGEAVRAVLDARIPSIRRHLENVADWAGKLADGARRSLDALPKEQEEVAP